MDPTDVADKSGYRRKCPSLAAQALSIAPTLTSSAFANDILYIPGGNYPTAASPRYL